jgi:HEAT repeat protein
VNFRCWLPALCAVVASCADSPERSGFSWETDDRLRAALAAQSPRGHFDQDTGDMLPVMVEKLATGGRDVQNHYRGELASGGPRVVRLIDDFVHRHSGTRTGTLMIGNALGVLGLCDDPSAVVVIRKSLGHPTESVRSAAIRAMAKQATPIDYEDLKSMLPTVGGELRRVLVQAMGKADPASLAKDLSVWIRDDGEAALSVLAARAVAAAGTGRALDPELLSLSASEDLNLRPFLAAALAATGQAAARSELIADLSDERLLVRTRALEAAAMAGLEELLLELVAGDPAESLRVLSSEAVSKLLPADDARAVLRQGLRDEAPLVRQACLHALLVASDPEAIEVFVANLVGDVSELGPSFRAVRGCWGENPELAERAATVLIGKLEEMGSRPIVEREPWLQALGQLPSSTGAEWLMDLARSSDGEFHNMATRRWLVLQMSNGGPEGRAPLVRAYRDEDRVEHRFDYLWAASLSAETDARDFLLEVVIGDESLDHERLFAAYRLTKLGSTPIVAPVLKRACLRVEDARVRPAFQSLLWTWYG